MTEHNLFKEVAEDLERQRLEALWSKYGAAVIVGAIVIVLATAAVSFWHSYHDRQQQKASDELVDILRQENEDTEKRVQQLELYATQYRSNPQSVLALLRAAQFEAQDGNKDKAEQIYDEVAKDNSADVVFRQYGDLMAVKTQMDNGDPKMLMARLDPLIAPDAPWRLAAMEYQGYLALKAGDMEKAKQLFTVLSQDAAAPQTVTARANDMLRYIGD